MALIHIFLQIPELFLSCGSDMPLESQFSIETKESDWQTNGSSQTGRLKVEQNPSVHISKAETQSHDPLTARESGKCSPALCPRIKQEIGFSVYLEDHCLSSNLKS